MEEAIRYVSYGIAIGLFVAGVAVVVYRRLKRRKTAGEPEFNKGRDVIPISRKATNPRIWKKWNREFNKRNA